MLTKPRKTMQLMSNAVALAVAASAVIHEGAIVVMENGFATKGRTGKNLKAIGVAFQSANNRDGQNGDQVVEVRKGVFLFDNDGEDPVETSDIGSPCFIVDDHTVAKTDDSKARSAAGTVFNVGQSGVWVEFT